MLYIFWVEKGSIITLHVDVAVDTVNNLKSVLATTTGISECSQVLLINGGESLRDGSRVAKYQSGTDTNPIFLFNRDAIESDRLPDLTSDSFAPVPDEQEAKESVEAVLNLPPNFNSIVSRTQLAQQYHDFAKEVNRQCSVLVQEQHLQHQGWQAVMANLDDVISAFVKRLDKFRLTFENYLTSRNEKLQHLHSFNENIEILSKIPLFPSLFQTAGTGTVSTKTRDDEMGEVRTNDQIASTEEMTILDWISAKDADHSLQAVAEGCRRTMETFDEMTLEDVMKESRSVTDFCNNSTMREIKGLAERLFGLDQLLSLSKKQVLEQKETADMLYRMQQQASSSREPQMFKDLAASFSQLLHQMLKCHEKLFDIKRRCLAAKQELCSHLHVRLKWVITVENGITEVDDKIKIYYENIKRIKRLTLMLDQVRGSPDVYVSAVEEVLRRRHYSNDFSQWADVVSKTANQAYNDETEARKSFLNQHGSHFLLALFPGLDQFPPQFATSPPGQFDAILPPITEDDLKNLLERIPNVQIDEKLLPHKLMPCPFTCQSPAQVHPPVDQSEFKRRVSFHGDYDVMKDAEGVFPECSAAERRLLDHLPKIMSVYQTLFKSLRACHLQLRQDFVGLIGVLGEMMERIRIETIPQVSQHILAVSQAADAKVAEKEVLFAEERRHYQTQYELALADCEALAVRVREREQEAEESARRLELLTSEHRSCSDKEMECWEALQRAREELKSVKVQADKQSLAKDEEISQLREALLAAREQADQRIRQIQTETDKKLCEREEEVNIMLAAKKETITTELAQQHQHHLQVQLSSHQSAWNEKHELQLSNIVVQMKIETEEKLAQLRSQLEIEFANTLNQQKQVLLNEMDRKTSRSASIQSGQLSPTPDEAFFARKDSVFLLSKSLSLTEPDSPRRAGQIQHELELSTSYPMDMSYMATSQPILDPVPLGGRTRNLSTASQNCITLSSCNMGDLVLFVYNKEFKQYTAYLPFKRSLYLLHSDSHVDLALSVPDHDGALVDVRSWVVAEIVGKEYVLTKKVPNRYRLQIGTKFYRVKAKSWDLESVLKEASVGRSSDTAGVSLSPSALSSDGLQSSLA